MIPGPWNYFFITFLLKSSLHVQAKLSPDLGCLFQLFNTADLCIMSLDCPFKEPEKAMVQFIKGVHKLTVNTLICNVLM